MKLASTPLILPILIAAIVHLPSSASAQTTFALWDWNSTTASNFNLSKLGTGTVVGYGQGQPAPSVPLSTIIANGTPTDAGTIATNGTNYNRSATVNPPLLTAANKSVGVMFSLPTTNVSLGTALNISWSQTIGYRSSRFWQLLVSTNGTNGAFFAPSGGTGSSISQLVTGYNSSTNLISGTATVNVDSSGLIDFRTINGNWISQAVITTGSLTNPLAAGFVDNISYTLPAGLGFENNANFAFAIVGAWDPSLGATSGTNGLVSSFAGADSTDIVNGYNRSVGSGGSMRLDLMTVSTVPEPSTYALLSIAAAALGAHILRRRK